MWVCVKADEVKLLWSTAMCWRALFTNPTQWEDIDSFIDSFALLDGDTWHLGEA